ncbi:DNA-binding IclR family transcriptional regulator [Spinactinospora alkalitolerans]|uniref:Glycerol operon regulatory protein n=1 Tax=Spinactinospora alkalitolerans TaxID=687207 RepID=A0A852TYL0_9ACTN|nr:IclR family transcriptional regulator [Spinactinospora alkalitolerans]NYE48082.1 DNA-binding IclR family transcriptional regulator [Spinactinospora alkalitolerans]
MPGRIQSVERAAAVLRLLAAAGRRLGVAELATALGLPKATVHGILRTLQHVGFVEQEEHSGKYHLGAALLHLGNSYLDVNELRTRALNWSDALATRSGESVRIGVPHEEQVLLVHHVFRPDDSFQVLDVGALLPVHATALGKVLLAYAPHTAGAPEEMADLKAFTSRTITSGGHLLAELAGVRDRGWACDLEEMVEGEVSVAAPIRDGRGHTVGAIGVSGAVERLCDDREPRRDIVSYVRDAARAISRDLGENRR